MSATRKAWRGRAVYERLLAERDREGLTFSELSERSGVPIGTLQRWGRRLGRERATPARPFVELLSTAATSSDSGVEVLLRSGRTLRLPARRPFENLGELVTLLESC